MATALVKESEFKKVFNYKGFEEFKEAIKRIKMTEVQRQPQIKRTRGVNTEFFKELTPDLAYVLGVWAAYGKVKPCYTSERRYYKNELRLFNKELMDFIVEKIEYRNKIKEQMLKDRRYGKTKILYTISFINEEVSQSIMRLTPNKPDALQLTQQEIWIKSKELFPAFILGYVHSGKVFFVKGIYEYIGALRIRREYFLPNNLYLGTASWELAHGIKQILGEGVRVEKRSYAYPYEVQIPLEIAEEGYRALEKKFHGYVKGVGKIRAVDRIIDQMWSDD